MSYSHPSNFKESTTSIIAGQIVFGVAACVICEIATCLDSLMRLDFLENRTLCRIEADIAAGIDVGQGKTANVNMGFGHKYGSLRPRRALTRDRPRYLTRPAKSYIDKLPNELLCEIIAMCGDPNATFDYPRDPRMDRTDITPRHSYSWVTMMAGYVCSRWFTVTRGCPTLWTLVDFMSLQQRHVVVMRLCLRYSAGMPLTLRLDETSTTDVTIGLIRRLANAIAENAGRWKELSIWLDSSLWQSFYGSPSLRRLQWWDEPFDLLFASSAPLGRLTHVGVKHIQPKHFILLLQLCPQLEVLQAVFQPSIEDSRIPNSELLPSDTELITLKNLRVLMLNGLEDYSRLYVRLHVPALSRLELHGSGVQAVSMRDMLKRSDAQLRMLTLFWLLKGWADDIKALLQYPEMLSLTIFRYAPCIGVWQTPMSETIDMSPFVPSHVRVFTSHHRVAEDAYRETRR
ncbi:uncharacterized protein SCHCODRAFT_0238601 [Schizophyllum commune H4-8]|uniref:F-box domain-containing protein n=1 Tax=Schizophyllum commune (strain H4-8 / FGSC 9210) TaxID=578458 RepID=D8QKW6_SCHCM|nr:uncharacterized protein SCHCODRAFT_0238601 [Schizophyllum commune H4-8]KAI5885403.1 hypothetical protein SCHCODRAFT_0238601 [Schizophyllum commune H4-8]